MRLNRRSFLRNAAGTAIALPLLESAGPSAARAQVDPDAPPRLVIYLTNQGQLPSVAECPAGPIPFSSIPTLQSLARFSDKISLITHLDNRTHGLHRDHGDGHVVAGHTVLNAHVMDTTETGRFDPNMTASVHQHCMGPSIDHYLSSQLGTRDPLNLAVAQTEAWANGAFYRVLAPGQSGANPLAILENDPAAVFQRELVGLPDGPPVTRADRFRAMRGSVLDGVSQSLASIRHRLSRRDQIRIESHLTSVRALEARLDYQPPVECGNLTIDIPPGFSPIEATDQPNLHIAADLMTTLMTHTLTCGAREIVTLHETDSHNPIFESTGAPIEEWHAQVHHEPPFNNTPSPDQNPDLIRGYQEYARRFGELLDKMDAVVEPNGRTLLDNSVVLWMTEFGSGQYHDAEGIPIIVAGGDGRLPLGRAIDGGHAALGNFFTSLLHVYGVMDESFGYNVDNLQRGPLPGLTA